jgi:uncharacterized coiled-coil protein SlyX
MDNDRSTDLEIRITFLEDHLQALDKVVQELGHSLDKTRRELVEFKEGQAAQQEDAGGQISSTERMLSERPPHY